MVNNNLVKLCLFIILIQSSWCKYLPVALWHGMGDSCCSNDSIGKYIPIIEDALPGITVLSLQFGGAKVGDIDSSYFANTNDLVEEACRTIGDNPEFANGYNAVGFSQGAIFMRALAQRCPSPPMRNLISLGGQQQGLYVLPKCGFQTGPFYCNFILNLLKRGYVSWIQNSLVQAQYWHNPLDEDNYINSSIFLAEINNAKDKVNASYRENLTKLNQLVLVKFENDTMVDPPESSWFGFYEPGQLEVIVPMQKTQLYIQNTLGLRDMYEQGRLTLLSHPGDHLAFTDDWFRQEIIHKYLNTNQTEKTVRQTER